MVGTRVKWHWHKTIILWAALSGCVKSQPAKDGPVFPVPFALAWGFIDQSGFTAIRPAYEGAREFSEGSAAVKVNGRWGYIDRSGKIVIQPVHRTALDFHGGLAIVDSGLPENPFGLMDKAGIWAVGPGF